MDCNYVIKQNDKFGRYLTAGKDLSSGELIFKDTPFVVGPKPDTPPLCLGCYCLIENKLCSQCGWPVCSQECEKSPQHAPECAVFCAAKVRFQPVEDWTASSPQIDCITPLRVLLAKESDPERWEREVNVMEHHTAARQQRPTWAADLVNIADYLVDHCKLANRFDKELIMKVCGILEVNSVEVPSRSGYSVRALYPRLSVAAHNCVPNVVHSIMQNDYEVHVRAAVPIKEDEILYLCYTYALSPTLLRRDFLMESKFFECDCSRCADPMELGTHLSTLKCNKCDNGVILCTNPLGDKHLPFNRVASAVVMGRLDMRCYSSHFEVESSSSVEQFFQQLTTLEVSHTLLKVDSTSSWMCNEKKCGFKTSSAAVRQMMAVVQAEIEQLDSLEPGPAAIEQREATLNKYKSVFHPKHSLLVSLKHTLAQLYGRVEGYNIDDLPDLMLERKAEFCRLVLKTLDVIMPGDTRMRGMMLYELHAPLMFMARNEFGLGLITNEKLKEKLQEPIRCLADAARILSREDPQSPEGITGQIAQQSMEQLIASLECL